MAISKITLNGTTQIDLTQDTVDSSNTLYGESGHKNDGTTFTGSVASQAAQTIYPSTSDQTISSGKYLSGTQTIKGVAVSDTLTAANIKSGVVVTIGDSADADRITSVTGTYEGSAGKNVQAYRGYDTVNTTSYTATDVTITVSKAGTYNVSWMGWRSYNTTTFGSQLYKNGTAVGTATTSFINTYGHSVSLSNQTFAKNDVLTIYARSSGTTRYMAVGNLIIEEV